MPPGPLAGQLCFIAEPGRFLSLCFSLVIDSSSPAVPPFLAAGQLRVIAEPGRYFTESIATLGCMVYGRRVRVDPHALAGAEMPAARVAGALPMRKRVHSCRRLAALVEELEAAEVEHVLGYDYWVTDGLYGSMNSVLYDHATLAARWAADLAC